MAIEKQYLPDAEVILSHRHDNGADLWTTPDKRLLKGAPWSALESAMFLTELGMDSTDPLMRKMAELFFGAWREDGRFKVAPSGGIYPCQTIHMAEALCRMGYAADPRLRRTFCHLLETQREDGGWKCNKYSFGRGPETEHSNPFPTLTALSAFRFSEYLNREPALDRAVEFLLWHWTVRKPVGPCHYGMGTLFMQVEYPFHNYNLFVYVYVLSFYDRAKKDERFLAALSALEGKLANGQVVVERVRPKLARLSFCAKGKPSALATKRYREILANMGRKGGI
ncbi:prenyltransferase [Christensenella tenuis]|uniref:Prenyltransferase n=1 Tax=Christensenella tenuis TaxID=2763033 RepID=A0ABR7EF33_9FIRM|nr:prenyltransferase [Christensenella tenuis]MBC5648380.1 prenyltransferase [Christensenella tenuis]